MTPAKRELWHLDKGIPISIVLMLIVQAAAAIWWVGDLSKQVQDNKERISRIEAQRVSERLTALESQMVDSRGSLTRIENKLDRLIEKGQP